MARFRCKHCKKIVIRNTSKQRVKSYCDRTGKNTWLVRIERGGK